MLLNYSSRQLCLLGASGFLLFQVYIGLSVLVESHLPQKKRSSFLAFAGAQGGRSTGLAKALGSLQR